MQDVRKALAHARRSESALLGYGITPIFAGGDFFVR